MRQTKYCDIRSDEKFSIVGLIHSSPELVSHHLCGLQPLGFGLLCHNRTYGKGQSQKESIQKMPSFHSAYILVVYYFVVDKYHYHFGIILFFH